MIACPSITFVLLFVILKLHLSTCYPYHRPYSHTRSRQKPWGFPTKPLHSSKASSYSMYKSSLSYGLASVDLSGKWLQLVQKDKVSVTTTVAVNSEEKESDLVLVRYGVQLTAMEDGSKQCMEFAEQVFQHENEAKHPLIESINSTLSSFQKTATLSTSATLGVKYVRNGPYAAQLQLVRTLRPPASPGFASSTSSKPPPYNVETDSFVTGPLRLELRPLVAELALSKLCSNWDVYHNVSPADARGHFLLLPSLKSKKNWRGQILTPEDCSDIVYLAETILPVGSLLLCFNSVGAGASQNHIHCHLWPSPPAPLVDDNLMGWECYAVSRIDAIYDFADVMDMVEVSYLNYPCFCVQLSSVGGNPESLACLGLALSTVLKNIGDAPHNVCILNRVSRNDDEAESCNDHDDGHVHLVNEHEQNNEKDEHGDHGSQENDGGDASHASIDVDVYVFVRSRERSPNIATSSKLGASEMMGVFHCQSMEQLNEFVVEQVDETEEENHPMKTALRDVSYENDEDLWMKIKTSLMQIQKQDLDQEAK